MSDGADSQDHVAQGSDDVRGEHRRHTPNVSGDVSGVHRRRSPSSTEGEHGAVTLWMLVLALMLLTLGGLSVDLWQVVSQRRALVAVADAAAYAGASGLDVSEIRAGSELVLDPSRARKLAGSAVRAQSDTRTLTDWRVEAGPGQVTVVLAGEIDTFLLSLLSADFEHLDVTVTSTAEPRRG